MSGLIYALGVVAMAAQMSAAEIGQAPLPPAPPWHGASERLVAQPNDPWLTPAERADFATTPSYAETRAWLARLDAASPLIRIETFGTSPQGRDLIVVIASEGSERDRSKPMLLAQAGIHAGEIDGKDAGLMLLRDIAFGLKGDLLSRANFAFIPILNVDGHERISAFNRPNQRGPDNQGWRNTAQNLNINRDYAKLDAPETRALVALIRRLNPALYLDLHVTDGIDYQYDITYGFQNAAAASSPAITRWLEQQYRPGIDAALRQAGHIPGDLIFALDDRNPEAGLAAFAFPPRFSHAYGDAIHMASVLVENHSLKPYRQRVLGTYVLLEASLRVLGAQGARLRTATQQDERARPAQLLAGWRQTEQPVTTRSFLAMQHDTYASAATGSNEIRWLGRPTARPINIPQYGLESTATLSRPRAYWVPSTKPEVIETLRQHGITFETLVAPRTIELEMLRLPSAQAQAAPSEGRMRVNAGAPQPEWREVTMPAGSVRVPTDQPLGTLAMLLLEPQSEDSFLAWGSFNEVLQRVEYMQEYAMAPLADEMLRRDPTLRAEFERKLAEDQAFAASPDARLAWFYARSRYSDSAYLLYPVGIER